jgi:hypothetical protein
MSVSRAYGSQSTMGAALPVSAGAQSLWEDGGAMAGASWSNDRQVMKDRKQSEKVLPGIERWSPGIQSSTCV